MTAKKSKASIEIIVKAEPDRYKENEIWYDGGLGTGNVDNHVDNGFDDNGKYYLNTVPRTNYRFFDLI